MSNISEILALSTVWGCFLTIAFFGLGTMINKKTGLAACNPLLLCTIFVIVFLKMTGVEYQDYKVSSSLISYLLFPATVSLAIPLYEKWNLLKANLAAIVAGLLAGVITSLGSIFAIAKIMGLDHAQYVTLLPKSVTTAIGMDVAAELGGMASLASGAIILTGIAGNLLAVFVCKMFKINNPIAKGIGIGSASHAIGTSKAMEIGQIEGAMSSLAIAAAGIITAFVAPLFAGFI